MSAKECSRLLQCDQQASIARAAPHCTIPPDRKSHAALEPALRQLEAVNDCGTQLVRKRARSGNNEITIVKHGFNMIQVDAGQGDKDQNLMFGFEHIERRLPGRQPGTRAQRPEQLPVQSLGASQHLASLRPHPIARKPLVHVFHLRVQPAFEGSEEQNQ